MLEGTFSQLERDQKLFVIQSCSTEREKKKDTHRGEIVRNCYSITFPNTFEEIAKIDRALGKTLVRVCV